MLRPDVSTQCLGYDLVADSRSVVAIRPELPMPHDPTQLGKLQEHLLRRSALDIVDQRQSILGFQRKARAPLLGV